LVGSAAIGLCTAILPLVAIAADAVDAVSAAGAIRPFRAESPETALIDMRQRLAVTRWPDDETVFPSS
jgi:hypothetical protein